MTIRARSFISAIAALAFASGVTAASAQDDDPPTVESPILATPDGDTAGAPPQIDFGIDAQSFGDLPPPAEGELLISPGDFGGTCTCAVVEPPQIGYDCDGMAAGMRDQARAQRGEMINACLSQTLDQCEAQQGPQACAALPAAFQSSCDPAVQGRLACAVYTDQIREQCRTAVDASMQRDFTPVLNQRVAQCRAQNDAASAPWRNWCETTAKPQSCSVCDAEKSDIATIEAEIDSHKQWITDRREGVDALGDDPNAVSDRLRRIRELEGILTDKREAYLVMQETGYCPTESEAESG